MMMMIMMMLMMICADAAATAAAAADDVGYVTEVGDIKFTSSEASCSIYMCLRRALEIQGALILVRLRPGLASFNSVLRGSEYDPSRSKEFLFRFRRMEAGGNGVGSWRLREFRSAGSKSPDR